MNYKNLEQKEGVIKVDGFDTGFLDTPTYAIVWFDCGVPIIAEPFGDYGSGRHYYNRETDFVVEDLY